MGFMRRSRYRNCTGGSMQPDDNTLRKLAEEAGSMLQKHRWKLITAESCTAGWIAQAITAVPGSSLWCEGGFITYSNAMKIEVLGVSAQLLLSCGAVCEPVVKAMAEGALTKSQANVSIAVTGIAGPDGGTALKPVGTVWIAWSLPEKDVVVRCFHFQGNRESIRRQTTGTAIHGLYLLGSGDRLCFNGD